MNDLEALKKARQLIASPNNWGTGLLYRWDRTLQTTQYCARGALLQAVLANLDGRVWNQEDEPLCKKMVAVMTKEELVIGKHRKGRCVQSTVADFNNNSTHQQVLDLFDRTIAA